MEGYSLIWNHLFYIILLIWLLVSSVAAYILCWWDKRAAKRPNHRRIPEKTLFFWALIGGSLGLWLGMRHFRHKTKHWYFVWGVPAIFVVQLILVALLLFYFPPSISW